MGWKVTPLVYVASHRPLQLAKLNEAAARVGATRMQAAPPWLLRRAPNSLFIAGSSSMAHLRDNLAVAELELPEEVMAELDGIAAAGAG